MSQDLPDVPSFAAAFTDFVEAMANAAQRPESPVAVRIREHLGSDPKGLPTTAAEFATTDHPNVQLALDAVLPDAEPLGFHARHMPYMHVGLTELLAGQAMTGPIDVGPVQWTDVEVGDGRVVRCMAAGVLLVQWEGAPVVIAVSAGGERPYGGQVVKLEMLSPDGGAPSSLVRAIRAAMREHNVYRGKVISLHLGPDHQSVSVRFHAVPDVPREGVILPDGTMERLERHAIGIAAEADRLRAAGRHLKRGILLHGPPGTGKTLSVNYLIAAMPGRTTVLLTGSGLGLITPAVELARELTPATVVFEDVDLVATERTMPYGGGGALFDLLNQMGGIAEDGDLLFLLTTNRPDLIEPALAARPGRVDLALEIPLPDAQARRRLVRLYAGGAELDEPAEADAVERTDGVSGAFVKELMRQAALSATLDGRERAEAADVRAALDELLADRSALTRRLLGRPAEGAAPGTPGPAPFPHMLHAFGAAGLEIPDDIDEDW